MNTNRRQFVSQGLGLGLVGLLIVAAEERREIEPATSVCAYGYFALSSAAISFMILRPVATVVPGTISRKQPVQRRV